MKELLKSKKFWTLVAAIVAALAAFFTVSCSGYQNITKKGFHCDSVYFEQFIRTKNFSSCLNVSPIETANCGTGLCRMLSAPFTSLASTTPRIPRWSRFDLPFLALPSCQTPLTPSTSSKYPFSIVNASSCLIHTSIHSLNYQNPESGTACLVCMTLAGFHFRRGGRKGKPRPRTKTVPLGGRHL